jgi:hypothetical protein
VAPLCATQVDGQAFFYIPNRPSEANARERVNTTIVTLLKGDVSAKQVEEEFTRIMSKQYRWTARKVADNKFTVRFPNALLIQEWSCFNPISMRNVKVKLQVEPWNGSIGVKVELQMAWFRVRGVPYDKRSKETLAYAGSLVGATVEVDKASLNRADYSRVKIAARDITKVPAKAEGAVIPYLYDSTYEREVEMGPNMEGNTILVQGGLTTARTNLHLRTQRLRGNILELYLYRLVNQRKMRLGRTL